MTRPAPFFSMVRSWVTAPQPVIRLEWIRAAAPLAILGFLSPRLIHAGEWVGDAGFRVPDLGSSDYRQPLYIPPLPGALAWGFALVLTASLLAVAAGLRARPAALIAAAFVTYAGLADRLASFTVTKLAPVVLLALALAPVGTRYGLDAWLRRRASPGLRAPSLVSGGAVRFFQVLLVVFYCSSGIAKAQGDWLKNPLVLYTHLHDTYQTATSYFLMRAMPPLGWTLLQGVTLSLETLAPLWFSLPRTRPLALVTAVGMHLMIGLMFGPVRWFALLMIALLIGCFLPGPLFARIARALDGPLPDPPPPAAEAAAGPGAPARRKKRRPDPR